MVGAYIMRCIHICTEKQTSMFLANTKYNETLFTGEIKSASLKFTVSNHGNGINVNILKC